jgi:hypothetical protein
MSTATRLRGMCFEWGLGTLKHTLPNATSHIMTLSIDERCNSRSCDFGAKPEHGYELCVRTVHVDELLHKGLWGESGPSHVMYPTSPSDVTHVLSCFGDLKKSRGSLVKVLAGEGVVLGCVYGSRDPETHHQALRRPPLFPDPQTEQQCAICQTRPLACTTTPGAIMPKHVPK